MNNLKDIFQGSFTVFIVCMTALVILGVSLPAFSDDASYLYDGLGRLVQITYQDGYEITKVDYAYDKAGNITHKQPSIQIQDSDGDQLPDGWENRYDLNPNNSDDAGLDSDGDGLSNLDEYSKGLVPTDNDTDDDGFLDGDEILLGSDPKSGESTPGNLIVNGGFDQWTESVPDYWQFYEEEQVGPQEIIKINSDVISPDYAVVFRLENEDMVLGQPVKVSPGRTYTLSFWVKPVRPTVKNDSRDDCVEVIVRIDEILNEIISFGPDDEDAWYQKQFQITVPSDSSDEIIFMFHHLTNTVYIDDVGLFIDKGQQP